MLTLMMCTDPKTVKAELFFNSIYKKDQKDKVQDDNLKNDFILKRSNNKYDKEPHIHRKSQNLKLAIRTLIYLSEFFPKQFNH